MGLKPDLEKFNQAKEWLRTCDITSHRWTAAFEHICYVYRTTESWVLRDEAAKIMTEIMGEDWLN